MALAEAEYLRRRFDLVIAIPDGPLRPLFACHGEVVDGTASMPLWGDSARRWIGRVGRTLLGAVRLVRVIRRADVELVLTNSSVSLAPVLAGRITRKPVIVHARDVPVSRLAPLVFRLHAALAHTVVVITDALVPYFSPGRGARTVRIPDGIELQHVGAAGFVQAPQALHDPLRLCVIGGIDPRKGQDIALAALNHLREAGVESVLDLVGREIDKGFAASLHRLADRLGLADRVRFLGELEDVREHLQGIDIVLAPSRGEWTPLSIMEAMAQQKPVVAANVGGVADVITDCETGLLVAAEDPEGLASAIAGLVEDPDRAAQIASRGRRSVERRFDIRASLSALEDEIERLLVGSHPRGREASRA